MSPPVALLAVALTAAWSGCGYTLGQGSFGATDAAGAPIRTVAVDVVANRTFRQRLAAPLTNAILAELNRSSDLQPAGRGAADAVLTVEIVDIANRKLIGDRRLPVREGSLDFAVAVALADGRTGAPLRSRQVIDRAEFRSPVGETEASARNEAVSDLARKIVLALEADF